MTVLLLIVSAAPARADDVAAAREHFQNGTKAYEVGEYEAAVREFSASYKLKADPAILFNLAQAQRLAGHNVEAERAYRTFLLKVPSAPNRAEIERIIAAMQKQRPGAPPALDDPDIDVVRRHFRIGAEHYAHERYAEAAAEFEEARSVKPLPTLDFNVARCYDRLERLDEAIAAYERYVSSEPRPGDADDILQRIAVLKERRARANAKLAAKPVEAKPVELEPANAGRGKRIAGIVVGVLGLAAVGSGIGLGVETLQESDRLSHPTMTTQYDARGLTYQNAEIGLLVTGGIALVTGVVLLAVGVREGRRAPIQASSRY